MAVTTKILFPATSNSSTTDFSLSGLQLNNQDDLDVYVTKTTAGIAANNNKRILHFRQSTSSNVDANHNQVNNTDGLYFPAITHTGGTETLENYQIVNNNGTVRFNSALPNGAIVFVERRTRDEDGTYTSFASGSTIRATDLNNSSTESNFTAQEARNKVFTIEGVLFDGDQPNTNFITTSHIGNDSVNGDKIADDSIDSEHYVDGSIDTQHIANGQITSAKMAFETIETDDIANSQITSVKIADNAVTTTEILNGAVTTAKIANGAITSAKIGDGEVTAGDIAANAVTTAKINDGHVTTAKLDANAVTTGKITDGAVTINKIADAAIVTNSEQSSHTVNDTTFFTTAAAEARYFNASTGETIKDGQAFPDNDTTIATTAAINDRIIDLVDDVGGFVPIANETSFPTTNPDLNNGSGTLVSIKSISSTRTPSSGTVTIANGAGSGNTVSITGCGSTVLSAGFGVIVETTSTLHTYAFHRLVPKATEVTTVAGKATEIGRLGTAAAVEDMSILGTAETVADMAILGTTDVVNDLNILGTADVVADLNTLGTADVVNDMNILGTSANVTAMSNCSNSIASINTAASNLNSINTFGDQYQVASNNPSTDGGGNALAAGDLYFNTSANELKVYTGSTWVSGVTATGNFALITGNTFTGNNIFTAHTTHNDSVQARFGTGNDAYINHSGVHAQLHNDVGNLYLDTAANHHIRVNTSNEAAINALANGAVQLYFDNVKKFETISSGVTILGNNSSGSFLRGVVRFCPNDSTTAKAIWDEGGFSGAGHLQVKDGVAFSAGDSSDLKIYHSSNVNTIIATSGALYLKGDATNVIGIQPRNGENSALFFPDGAVELYYNNAKKLETTSTGIKLTSGGSGLDEMLRLNASGNSNGHGSKIAFSRAGDLRAEIQAVKVETAHNETDIVFKTTKTGSLFEALRIVGDTGHVQIPADNKKLLVGASQDLELYHTGSNSFIDNNTGHLYLRNKTNNQKVIVQAGIGGNVELNVNYGEAGVIAKYNNATELYYDNSKKLETKSTGVGVTGTLDVAGSIDSTVAGADNTLIIETTSSGSPKLQFNASGAGGHRIEFLRDSATLNFTNGSSNRLQITAAGHTIPGTDSLYDLGLTGTRWRNVYADTLYGDGSNLTGINTDLVSDSSPQLGGDLDANGHNIKIGDGEELRFGDSNDLIIKHDSANTYISNQTGELVLNGDTIRLRKGDGLEDHIKCFANGSVELYQDGTKKFQTNSGGVETFGHLVLGDNRYIKLGGGTDVQIFHNGSNFHIQHLTSGSVYFDSIGDHNFRSQSSGEYRARFDDNGSVKLYYNGSEKIRTIDEGVRIMDNFLGVNVASPTGSPASRNAFLGLGDSDTGMAQNGDGQLEAWANNQEIMNWDTGGITSYKKIIPSANNTHDLGSTSNRWANIYTNDLNLSNEGGSNDVDGTWGNWTIQEGESDLFLKNNRSGKKYKFNLMEVS